MNKELIEALEESNEHLYAIRLTLLKRGKSLDELSIMDELIKSNIELIQKAKEEQPKEKNAEEFFRNEIWTIIDDNLEEELLLSSKTQDLIYKKLEQFANQSEVKNVSDEEIVRVFLSVLNGCKNN